MDISELPFNKFIGLKLASSESGFQTSLPSDPKYTNHIGTVHASAMLVVAEAGSGAFLARHFSDYSGFISVVRRLEAKFRRPGKGQISARCLVTAETLTNWATELTGRGRLSASIPVEVIDSSGMVVMSATVDWFISNENKRQTTFLW